MCYPNSNASSERVWSKLKLIKTALRNKLNFINTRGAMLAYQFFHDTGGIETLKVTPEMLIRMNTPLSSMKKKSEQIDMDYSVFGNIKLTAVLKKECFKDDYVWKEKYRDPK